MNVAILVHPSYNPSNVLLLIGAAFMMQEFFMQEEGKTLEFKKDASSLNGIVKTVVAFANTAGGTIVIGVEDATKKIVGIKDPLEDEMRIINKIAESVTPLLRPNIDIQTYRNKTLILVQVPYLVGPYSFNHESKRSIYVRFGSSNRIADDETIATMRKLSKNITFDETVCVQAPKDGLDWLAIERTFESTKKTITKAKIKSIGMITNESGEDHPSNGGMLLFGKNRSEIFPDALIRCVRFAGFDRSESSDSVIIDMHLSDAIDEVLHFIEKNTFTKTEIGRKKRVNVSQYPSVALREAVINAIVHADYSIKGSSIIVALFDDRIEITNPGAMIYGLSLAEALAGSSRIRNRVIARTFHILELVEQWGSGLQKIITSCVKHGLKKPKFEEMNTQFRVTIYSAQEQEPEMPSWKRTFIEHLSFVGELSTKDAAEFWGIDVRNARNRLKGLVNERLIVKIGTSPHDPASKYIIHASAALEMK